MKKKSKIVDQKLSISGFSLVELLVASAIFITVSVIIISSLFVTFRLSRKTEVVRLLKQSGDSAMTQMVNQIKYAASLDDPISCLTPVEQNSITITSSADSEQTVFSCPTDDSNTISSNSASLIDTTRVVVYTCSFSCSQGSVNHPPTVTISYGLLPIAFSENVETQGITSFQTSVTMRNYSR